MAKIKTIRDDKVIEFEAMTFEDGLKIGGRVIHFPDLERVLLGDFLFLEMRGYCAPVPIHIQGRLFERNRKKDVDDIHEINNKLMKLRDSVRFTSITQDQAKQALERLLPHSIQNEIYEVHSVATCQGEVDIDNLELEIENSIWTGAIDTGAEICSVNRVPKDARYIRDVKIRTNNRISTAQLYEFSATLNGITDRITAVQVTDDGGIPRDIYLSRSAGKKFKIKVTGMREE